MQHSEWIASIQKENRRQRLVWTRHGALAVF
jgi:hypothetical protein